MEDLDNKLLPVLTEAVGVVKMACFKQLKEHMAASPPELPVQDLNRLAGSVINDLFCSPNLEPDHVTFVRENRGIISQWVRALASQEAFRDLRRHLTDALRVAFMCDHHQGLDRAYVLTRALSLGILIEARTIPLPRTFIESVRVLGDSLGLVIPAIVEEAEEDEQD